MNKKLRQEVYNKFGGKCAYSGKVLPEDWQVDHMEHKTSWKFLQYDNNMNRLHDPNHIDNLLPTLKILNHYKRAKSLEQWREYLNTLHQRLAKLPKKTRVEKRKKYVAYMLAVADHFGITADKPFNGVFYFETIINNH